MFENPKSMMDAIGQLETFAQRIVDGEGKTKKVELLSRLPKSFGAVALEKFFGEMTPEQTLDVTENQMRLGDVLYSQKGISSSINVDNSVFVEDRLKDRLMQLCSHYRYPRVLEFTEIRPMPPADEINAIFFELKQHDITIALDDFGTGFNGMSIFADYDFDIIKIDQSMIIGLESRPQKKRILGHIREMLSALDKTHVVEGVETQERFDTLRELGFDTFQGYLFHKPARLEEIT